MRVFRALFCGESRIERPGTGTLKAFRNSPSLSAKVCNVTSKMKSLQKVGILSVVSETQPVQVNREPSISSFRISRREPAIHLETWGTVTRF